jgi:DNA-binding IclR family transcriptional regulator
MRRKALSREEREIQVINWFALRFQHDNEEYATVYEIARGLGLSPSSHLSRIVHGLEEKGSLESIPLERSGRWPSRGYRLKSGTLQRPPKQSVKVNFTVRGVRQMELI